MDTHKLIALITHQLLPYYKNRELCQNYAWWLLEKLLHTTKIQLIITQDIHLTVDQTKTLDDWITQLTIQHKPIQYTLGSVPFNELDILVEPPTLIPRPETEEWSARLIAQLQQLSEQNITILDLATGSGCIGLSLAHHLPHAHISASDISPRALQLADKNKSHNNITNIHIFQSDLFKNISAHMRFDLIVANPPYIAESERSDMEQSVVQWEDEKALFATDNGLDIIKQIIAAAPTFIRSNAEMKTHNIPQIMIEIGHTQGTLVAQLMLKAGYNNIQIIPDLNKKDRVVVGRVDYVATTAIAT